MSLPIKVLPLVPPEKTIETISTIENGFILVGGPKEQVWGTLDFITMFIWTSRENVTDFINNNELDPKEELIQERPLQELIELARRLSFKVVLFDFQAKGVHPNQAFVNYKLNDQNIQDLLAEFHSM